MGSRGHETVTDRDGDVGQDSWKESSEKKRLLAQVIAFFTFLREGFCLLAAINSVSVKIISRHLQRIRLKIQSEKQVLKTVY